MACGCEHRLIKANKDFLYNRVFGVGLFKLFGDAGIETVDNELLTKYANKLGYRYTRCSMFLFEHFEYSLFSSAMWPCCQHRPLPFTLVSYLHVLVCLRPKLPLKSFTFDQTSIEFCN